MKSFHEQFKNNIDLTDGSVVLREDMYKAIQLDAMKEGAKRAAEICVNTSVDDYGNLSYCKESILKEVESWTTKDLS